MICFLRMPASVVTHLVAVGDEAAGHLLGVFWVLVFEEPVVEANLTHESVRHPLNKTFRLFAI